MKGEGGIRIYFAFYVLRLSGKTKELKGEGGVLISFALYALTFMLCGNKKDLRGSLPDHRLEGEGMKGEGGIRIYFAFYALRFRGKYNPGE